MGEAGGADTDGVSKGGDDRGGYVANRGANPKKEKEYRGIGLVEVTWKVVAAILHCLLTTAITYHNALHGFWAGRGTGTATLEAKLLQQLASMREEVLYVIFLDLTKAHDALDRSRSLEILEG